MSSQHSILIEVAVAQIRVFPTPQLELPAAFGIGDRDSRRRQRLPMTGVLVFLHDMEGLVAVVEAFLDERQQHAILLLL